MSAGPVVGREREVDTLRLLLDRVRAGETVSLVLVGEPGIGKTALLDETRRLADGFLVLSARGAEPESGLAHAGLLQLLTPLRHLLPEVPEGQAAALGVALGWTSSTGPVDRFLVAAGTLSLLAAAAATWPVLVLVDDLQWLDRESADALLFAARRLGSDAVGFVMDTRTGGVAADQLQGLVTMEVDGLGEHEVARLLRSTVAPSVVAALAGATRGNPLALLEVSARLTTAQRSGAAPLPDPLPVGARLDTVYDAELADLAASLRHALLLVALDPAAATTTVSAATLDEAASRGLLVADAQGVRFRHPLLRSAVVRLASPEERREAHRTLAARLDASAPGRTHHLSAAAHGPDDDLAARLVRVAADDRARLGFAAASSALEHAARLTTDADVAAHRLAAAAQDSFEAGDLERTRDLVDRVLARHAPPEVQGRALLTLGMLEQYAGSVVRAADHLGDACALLDGGQLVDALTERAMVAFRLGDLASFADCARRVGKVVEPEDPGQRLRARFTSGVSHALAGDHAAARRDLGELTDLALSDALRADPRALLFMALASAFTGTVAEALRRGSGRVDDVRRRGAVGVLVPVLAVTAAGRALTGDHARAYAEAGEAVELAEWLGFVADTAVAVEQLAWQSAARGLHDEAQALLGRAEALVARSGTATAAAHHAITAAFCALCRDELDAVVRLLEARLGVDGGMGTMGEPLGVAPLLVEAYVGLGRAADAVDLSRRLAEATPDEAPAELVALRHRCEGLVAVEGERSEAAFGRALEQHARAVQPFEEARTRLLHGSRLRRDGQRVAAREQLGLAHAAFRCMELTRWADLAAAELAATGARLRRHGAAPDAALTSQETRVALLVAEGRSNKEVAAALFLSPKTIERHLGSVFRKKGFRSRTELARAFARAPVDDDPIR